MKKFSKNSFVRHRAIFYDQATCPYCFKKANISCSRFYEILQLNSYYDGRCVISMDDNDTYNMSIYRNETLMARCIIDLNSSNTQKDYFDHYFIHYKQEISYKIVPDLRKVSNNPIYFDIHKIYEIR